MESPLGGFGGGGRAAGRDQTQSMYGAVNAKVTDNVCGEGPFDKDYRVRVTYPWLPGTDQSYWARICTIGAGPDRGTFWLPEVGDEVIVVFINGSFDQPIIVGAVWNGVDKPTYTNKDASGKVTWASFQGKHEAKKNDLRMMTSRKFHQLIFNDNADEPRVALHSSQKHRIVLDDKGNEANKIEIYDGKEENYILIDTKNKKITIETKTGDMLLQAKGTITLECNKLVTHSKDDTKMTADNKFTIDAKSNFEMHIQAEGKLTADSPMTIKGSKIDLNP